MTFNNDFYWGGSVTAHQSEGAYTACGKSPAVCDYLPKPEHSDFKDGIHAFYHYDEDFKLLKELGINSYRFSIDWSRVMPDGEHFSEEGIQFYNAYINCMVKYNIDPICTLYHFEMPQCLMEEYNGFYSRIVVDKFVKFANKMIDCFGDRVKKWISFNEQNGFILKQSKIAYGAICPEGISEELFTNQLVHNSLIAHALITQKVHTIKDALMLGMVIYIPSYPETCNPIDVLAAQETMAKTNLFLDVFVYGKYPRQYLAIAKTNNTMPNIEEGDLELLYNNRIDWISISYYMSSIASHSLSVTNPDTIVNPNPFLPATKWGWTIDPLGLRIVLKEISNRYRLPIIITENGMGLDDTFVDGKIEDDIRIAYMKTHLEQLELAIEEGVDCRGYLMWSPIDILSSKGEMAKRYGVIYVDRDDKDLKTMKRYKKKSFTWFQKVISSNGTNL